MEAKAGTMLITENDRSRKMFIVKKGKVRVFKTYLGQRITLAILGEGEIFGELSFFDAEPRTASVEALTDVTLTMIDGEQANKQITQLPEWVVPIFRSVFHRFREADNKITVLQSMNEYQKRSFKRDTVAKTIYLELQRFIKTMEILHAKQMQASGSVKSNDLLNELDDLLGERHIGLKVFWRLLKEYDFIDLQTEEKEGLVLLKTECLENFKQFLAAEVKSERFLLLSHATIALLRKLVAFTNDTQSAAGGSLSVTFEELKLERLPLHEEALKELAAKKLLIPAKNVFVIDPAAISRLYTYQCILKSFDHTIVNLD